MRILVVSFFLFAGFMGTGPALAEDDGWISLFNGENLDGWVVKIRGYELGENFGNTFRVEDGLLTVSYDEYDSFDERFGHIFYGESFSHYIIRAEYRFIGEQCKNGPGWALRNSGIMLHCQPPDTMTVDQDFPASIEVQLLGGDGTHPRTTGNLCTPGTNVVMDSELITRHCTNSVSDTFHGEQWVTAEVEVFGNKIIRHLINGHIVLEYMKPQLDENTPSAKRLLDAGADLMLSEGYISLQAESHPVQYRKVEILPLVD